MQEDTPKARAAGAREVSTNQTDIYDKLEEVVRKYALSSYLRPIAEHTREAFAQAEAFIRSFYERTLNEIPAGACPEPVERAGMTTQVVKRDDAYKVILDSGCGTGESTVNIALAHPDTPVIGIDKSVTRLTKADSGAIPPNAFLVRAELLDFWRLALDRVTASCWSIPYHALYYPNPWPKQSEATRRFHLHPIFPTLLQLGDTIELRTNWEIYAREFAEAVQVAKKNSRDSIALVTLESLDDRVQNDSGDDITVVREPFSPELPITAFERKYKEARQQLWRVIVSKKI